MTRPLSAIALVAALTLPVSPAAAQRPPAPAAQPPATKPKLVVFIAVDQLRGDYIDRWRPQLTGGLARLATGGAFFPFGYQDHAITETAPGHSTMLSGRFPRSTGITMNAAGVGDPQNPLLGGGGWGASPFRFRGSVLMDWMRRADPRSRALSVSRKDRGAILPLGRTHQNVFWYAPDSGRFTTSTYYADTLPTWVRRFNRRRLPASYAGRRWELLLPASAYPEPDSVAAEGPDDFAFPHVLSSDPARAVQDIQGFPWMDELIVGMALEGLRALDLGRGPQTDLLSISLSTTDAVGHRYGPDSREIHDQILRLDRTLDVFLDSLYAMRDSATIAIALTADHGVTPFIQLSNARGVQPPARAVTLVPMLDSVRAGLRARGLPDSTLDQDGAIIIVDRAAFARAGVSADSVLDVIARRALRIPGVMRADRPATFARADTVRDDVARRWIHMLPPDLPAGLVVTLDPFSVWTSASWATPSSAHHGSPREVDARVPIIFYGPWFAPGRHEEHVRVVDIAPTLAAVVGVTPTERLDGRVLRQALGRASAAAASGR